MIYIVETPDFTNSDRRLMAKSIQCILALTDA